ncbi:hypothetical protein DFA_07381 [Cavenderia fasciculata]|uniref:Uncharacterized protein n=1 Tax=Cavenderia fasciculata TaxID=261658 RepID=F4PW94_CACFS|nr:uncharacterized protein DFA_07381 [Cavenderia fasciculata]EGG20258.1 hypothetical protein DFA_07381 [Cavenderia fasciculata]|eukprot:XP_004367241.1 hypothetical protein DFA_07381 [Cavenderia fasciculata]
MGVEDKINRSGVLNKSYDSSISIDITPNVQAPNIYRNNDNTNNINNNNNNNNIAKPIPIKQPLFQVKPGKEWGVTEKLEFDTKMEKQVKHDEFMMKLVICLGFLFYPIWFAGPIGLRSISKKARKIGLTCILLGSVVHVILEVSLVFYISSVISQNYTAGR